MEENQWPLTELFNNAIQTIRGNQMLNIIYRIIVTLIQVWISTWAVLWVSVFLYIIFYNIYIPTVQSTKEVFIQYDSKCDLVSAQNSCKIPFANIPLTEGRTPEFMRGQTYHFSIDLALPESDVNWSQGMFMVRLTLFDQKRNIAVSVAKPTGLKYKSSALRGVFLLLYWPLYVMGLTEEIQYISMDLITNFIEGSHLRVGSTTEALIEFEARDIQIYPPTYLRITAALTGLRYYMYYWKITSFLFGTTSLCFFLYIFTLIGFTRWYQNDQNNDHKNGENDDNQELFGDIKDFEDNQMDEELVNQENDRIEEEIQEELDEDLIDENIGEDPHNESGLTGDLSDRGDNETEDSEDSSTVVIPENEDVDDSQQVPDSSSTET